MKNRSIEIILPPPAPHMVGDGFRVHSFFPGGRIAHHDSAGNSGIIGEGDVQWMTAASGLLHKEYHEKEFSRKGGLFQMVQLWVNLPAKYKMTPPKYQEITNSMMGHYSLADGKSFVEVLAGEYKNVKGPASTFTPMHVSNARLKKSAEASFGFPSNYNTALLVIEGSIAVNDASVNTDSFVLFKNDGEDFTIKAAEDSIVLILSGEPIDEPIAQYGPFLMNTWEELEQAIADVNAGKFGMLED